DGVADLVVALEGSNQVAVLCQDNPPTYTFTITSSPATGTGCVFPQIIALGDLEDNGRYDVVAGNTGTNNLTVFHGNGAGAIAFVQALLLHGPGVQTLTGVLLGDYNRDCRLDILTTNLNGENFAIYLGHGDATFADAVTYNSEIPANQAGANVVAF